MAFAALHIHLDHDRLLELVDIEPVIQAAGRHFYNSALRFHQHARLGNMNAMVAMVMRIAFEADLAIVIAHRNLVYLDVIVPTMCRNVTHQMAKVVGVRLEGDAIDTWHGSDRNCGEAQIGTDVDVGTDLIDVEVATNQFGQLGGLPCLQLGILGDDVIVGQAAFNRTNIAQYDNVANAMAKPNGAEQVESVRAIGQGFHYRASSIGRERCYE